MSKIFKLQDANTVVYYADGVHPTHNCRTTCGWIEKGSEFKQPMLSGRDRVNINTLINARDVTDVLMLDCASVNADSTQALYQKSLERNPDAKKDVEFREAIKKFFDNISAYKSELESLLTLNFRFHNS